MREKQIDEMVNDLCGFYINTIAEAEQAAEHLISKGWIKQSEGEWNTVVDNKDDIVTECSACKKHFWFMKKGQLNIDRMPFCPNCGARMKGGAE